jgi:flap endonuclease-1
MGVHNFFKIKIVNRNSSFDGKTIAEWGEIVKLSKFKGERIAIDASWTIYTSMLALASVSSLTDEQGNPTAHLNTIFNKVIQLADAGIQQIWVFDSPQPNEMKKLEYQKRSERRKTGEAAGDDKVAFRLQEQHVNDVKKLLTLMGIMFIEAPPGVEAEQFGAYLTRGDESERFCKYMISGDSDVLFFGGNLLRLTSQKSATGKSSKTIYQAFNLDELLNEMDMTYDDFLKMGVAMGSDFNEKAPRVGPATVIKAIRDGKVFIDPSQQKAINYFKSNPLEVEGTPAPITVQGDYQKDALIEFLVSKKFNKDRIAKRLEDYKG